MTTPRNVAEWMLKQFEKNKGELYQEDIVYEIEAKFGEEFVYTNRGGSLSIGRKVLAEF